MINKRGKESHLTLYAAIADKHKTKLLNNAEMINSFTMGHSYIRVYCSCLQSVMAFGRFYFSLYHKF